MKSNKTKNALIEQLGKTPIVEAACSKIGIGRTTFYRWKKEDKEFAERAEEAICQGLSLISDIAESQLINAIKTGQLTAIIFWLRNHRDTYKTKVEISGQINNQIEALDPEQEALVREALRLASLASDQNPNIENNEKQSDNSANDSGSNVQR